MISGHLICRLYPANWVRNVCRSGVKEISTQSFPLQFKISPALWGEPLKKKRKIDPAIIKAREEKKKKKLMKEIRKLERLDKQLKPVATLEIPPCLLEKPELRKRYVNVSKETAEERILLLKQWTKIKLVESISDFNILHGVIKAQKEALDELRIESEELYQAAVRIDPQLIPLKFNGPKETPPKKDFPIPDGAYIDVSKKWAR